MYHIYIYNRDERVLETVYRAMIDKATDDLKKADSSYEKIGSEEHLAHTEVINMYIYFYICIYMYIYIYIYKVMVFFLMMDIAVDFF
jgi:hypothetical protein